MGGCKKGGGELRALRGRLGASTVTRSGGLVVEGDDGVEMPLAGRRVTYHADRNH